MNPKVRIGVIETSKQIILGKGKRLSSKKIIKEYNKLVEGLGIPKIVTKTVIRKPLD